MRPSIAKAWSLHENIKIRTSPFESIRDDFSIGEDSPKESLALLFISFTYIYYFEWDKMYPF
jgi:hypothetical protein